MTKDIERSDSWDRAERERDIRQGIDLATTLERIEKNFVITDPRLPDNPIVSHNLVTVTPFLHVCFYAPPVIIEHRTFFRAVINVFVIWERREKYTPEYS